jgi:hypothetical protein
MFDHVQRVGLMGRITTKFDLAESESVVVAYPVATACYPKAMKSSEDGILEPIIPVALIRHLTEQCVDYGVGTLDDLYEKIWGMRFQEYLTTFVG